MNTPLIIITGGGERKKMTTEKKADGQHVRVDTSEKRSAEKKSFRLY